MVPTFTPPFRGWVTGYGVTRLAGDLGVSRSAVYDWFSGRRVPRIELAVRIIEISSGEVNLADIYEHRMRVVREHQR